MKNKYLWILVFFMALLGLLAVGLSKNASEVPSPLIGKAAPAFTLERLAAEGEIKTFSPQDYAGQVWLLNVWASWCVSCRDEHPMLVELSQKKLLPIVGLNYKEVRGDAAIDSARIEPPEEIALARTRANRWLTTQGNPYDLTVLDLDGRVSIDYGVYGVPETYLIDKAGVIRFKQIGPLTPEVLTQKLLPLIEELKR
ncbi:MAG: DsbE family thiol:disulfide interchange protein [Zoogloeaceae bacterium]|nr:DsbE family thiol:disulfide interchange protein [Zoogloeaceae bacterium]